MRITELHIQGEGDRQAVMSRPLGSDAILVKLLAGVAAEHHEVQLIDTEHQLAMASTLHNALTGRPGIIADVAQYNKAFRLRVDP